MRLEQLHSLEAVVRLGSFRRAASSLYLSQPSVTQQILALEREFGLRLLTRGRRGVRPTEAGAALLERVRALLAAETALKQEAASLAGVGAASLRVGCVDTALIALLPQVIRRLDALSPGVHVNIVDAGSREIEGAVALGDLDVGLVSRFWDTRPPDGIASEALLRQQVLVCAPVGHPLMRRKIVRAADVVRYRQLIYGRGYALHDVSRRILDGLSFEEIEYTGSHENLLRLVAGGAGVTFVLGFGDRFASDPSMLQSVAFRQFDSPSVAVGLCMVRRSADVESPPLRIFSETVRAEARIVAANSPNALP